MFIFLKVSHWKVWCSYLYQNQESYYIFYVNSTFSNDTQAHDTYRDTHNCWYQLETIKSYIQPLLFSPCPLKCLYFTSLYVQLKQLAYGFNLQSVSVCVVSILLSDAISLWETQWGSKKGIWTQFGLIERKFTVKWNLSWKFSDAFQCMQTHGQIDMHLNMIKNVSHTTLN